MIDFVEIESLFNCAKRYKTERVRFEKISNRSSDFTQMTRKAVQKRNADLDWSAMALIALEAELHARCVDAGVADIRPVEHYQPRTLSPTKFHSYRASPALPKCMQRSIGDGDTTAIQNKFKGASA